MATSDIHPLGVRVVRKSAAHPASDESIAVFRDLLDAAVDIIPTRFQFDLESGEVLEPHRQPDADVAAGVVTGHLIFGVGPDLRDEVDLAPGGSSS